MPSRNPGQRLQDIVDNAVLIERFLEGVDADRFAGNLLLVYAVERAVLIIAEAAGKLPEDIKSAHPEIDWRALNGIGNKIRHDYDEIERRFLWETLNRELGPLKDAAQVELDGLGSP